MHKPFLRILRSARVVMLTRRALIIPCIMLGAVSTPSRASAAVSLVVNGDFRQAGADGVPVGWAHNTKGRGYVKTHTDATPPYVEIGIVNGPEDSFIQQVIPVNRPQPEGAARVVGLKLAATCRHEGIVPGSKSHECGKVQARFTKGGKDFGAWIDLGDLRGTSKEWTTVSREVDIPAEADGLLLRLGFYGTKAGKLEVASVVATPVTAADRAAERAKHRPAGPYGPAVSAARYGRIMRGININGWFCQPWNQKIDGKKGGFNEEFLQGFITGEDIGMIAAMGYDHVRLPVDPILLMDVESGALEPRFLPELDRAMAMIRAKGLAVIVDVHPKSPAFKGLAEKPALCEAFVAWWGCFARHLAGTTDPEWVFLELLNEPGGQKFWAGRKWQDYQDRLISVVRANAPEHTLVANGGGYMLARELGKVAPHPDRNVLWAVHYYEPSPFTHQGALWMKEWYHPLQDVPWPFGEDDVEPAIARLKAHKAKAQAAQVLRDMAREGTATREHMAAQVALIAAWGREHGIRVHVGEYGVVDRAPRESRLRYLAALNAEFEKHGLARAMWNYGGGSGFSTVLGPDEPGKRKPDWELVEAMGMAAAQRQTVEQAVIRPTSPAAAPVPAGP